MCKRRFGNENQTNKNINDVVARNVKEIPDHDLLLVCFPRQDYSVATTLHNSGGLRGKKGALWWAIHQIPEKKKRRPKYLFLENVDRSLTSPSKQKGRDFAVMLKSPDKLGYASRTSITAEGGRPPSRFKHVVKSDWGLRRLTPVAPERLNMFPDNHTGLAGISNTRRACLIRNALVVGMVNKIGESLYKQINP